MKFAVKTVTCLGCKTPLRSNNSVKGERSLLFPIEIEIQNSFVRWRCLQQLSASNWRTIPEAGRKHLRFTSALFTTLDTMSKMSRLPSSGSFSFAI